MQDGKIETDELRTIEKEEQDGDIQNIVIGSSSEIKLIDKKRTVLMNSNIPYGAEYNDF